MIVQRLKRDISTDMELAEKYYSILSAINNLHLTEREIQLIAFTAIKGNITFANVREEFCKTYKSTSPTINNIVSKLKKIGVFVKENGKVKVNPIISIDFKKDITLDIRLVHEEANINVGEGMDNQENGNQPSDIRENN
jgi:TATA-box binding protein (TBP) (component of TFIID and TFIIIB)